ncbi:MAG TPA: tRNA lysidine(34) synthetase TilS [Micavibrio sp.]|nr:tRNA lysidine(34) synthetase TilS [Micavibrio sp.]
MGFSYSDFIEAMEALPDIPAGEGVAAGVSGGPDSMAMLWLLSRWAGERGISVMAYTVDHGLRRESADEARAVGAWVKDWPNVTHEVLVWEGEKPGSRILEEARSKRYALMAAAMKEEGAAYLFIAHHRDDQAETFLIRLAKGSGLDGLAGMRAAQKMESGITLLRPLLDVPKEKLILLCKENGVPYVDDPTNKNERYLRPRLRAAQGILEEEGLSAKRLGLTAKRLGRASSALAQLANGLFAAALKERRGEGFVFDYGVLQAAHEELVLRVFLYAMDELRPGGDYGPRLEKAEKLTERILHDPAFKGATLGGCIFAKDAKNATLVVGKE